MGNFYCQIINTKDIKVGVSLLARQPHLLPISIINDKATIRHFAERQSLNGGSPRPSFMLLEPPVGAQPAQRVGDTQIE